MRFSVSLVALGACVPTVPAPLAPSPPVPPVDAGSTGEDVAFVTSLSSTADLLAVANEDNYVDFLVQVDGAPVTPPIVAPCVFINGNLFQFRSEFVNAMLPPDEVMSIDELYPLYVSRDRVWWGGALVYMLDERRPSKGQDAPIAWYVVDDGTGLGVDDVIAAHRALTPCMSSALASRLEWRPYGSAQLSTIEDLAALEAAGVAVH